MSKRWSKVAGVIVFVAALFGAAPGAQGQTAPALPPFWKINVTASAATLNAGRLSFVEHLTCDSTSFTGEQIARFGFETTSLTATAGAPGVTNVNCTMRSNTQGNVTIVATVTSTMMTGTINWTVSGTTYAYTFNGVPFTPVESES